MGAKQVTQASQIREAEQWIREREWLSSDCPVKSPDPDLEQGRGTNGGRAQHGELALTMAATLARGTGERAPRRDGGPWNVAFAQVGLMLPSRCGPLPPAPGAGGNPSPSEERPRFQGGGMWVEGLPPKSLPGTLWPTARPT